MIATWRQMRAEDIGDVAAIAAIVHPDYPEDAAVFAERIRLYPDGCFVLQGADGALGYVLSHPWLANAIPKLNTLLGALPETPATYYLHDIALLPQARGQNAAAEIAETLASHACRNGFATLSLCAVNGSAPFWGKHGFGTVNDSALTAKLASYDAEARFMTRAL